MEGKMAKANKTTISYGLDKEYLKTCTIFGKARMNVNKIKNFSINNNAKQKSDFVEYDREM